MRCKRKGIVTITLALIIVISPSLLSIPNNSNYQIVNALSKKDFSSSFTKLSTQSGDEFFYKMVDGHRNRCYNDYKLNVVICARDDVTNNNISSTSSLRPNLAYSSNYSQIAPTNIDSGKFKNSNSNNNYNSNNDQNSASDKQNQNKLQKKIEKLQSRIDKLKEQSRIQELEYHGTKSSSTSPLSSVPPPVPTAMTNSTLEYTTNNNSTLQSLTAPPPAALSSSPASSHTREHPILTQDTGTNKSSTTNWVFNDDKSNRDNYTYTSGLASSPLILPVGNTHTTSTDLSTSNRDGGTISSTSSPSKPIDRRDIAGNAITNSMIANNAVPTAKLSRDAVHLVWDDFSPDSEILYRTNAGDVFARSADNLSTNAGVSDEPAIAVSGNNVYVVWRDNTPGRGDIFYAKSIDGGATFGSIVNLSDNIGSSGTPDIAISGNNVYVAWNDNTGTGEDTAIYYRRSVDGGATFGSIFNLSNNAGSSLSPAIAVSGNHVYVVWDDNTETGEASEILYRRSVDGGATFGNTINLSNTAGFSGNSDIAVSGNNVYVVWNDNAEILYRRSVDGGATFGSIFNLSNNAGGSGNPSIAVAGNNAYVTWSDNTPGNADILLRKSDNAGVTFGSTINVSQNAGFSELPAISVSPNNF
ncbi:MAG: sialidase family protein [Nitrososphaeraceae archaeon]